MFVLEVEHVPYPFRRCRPASSRSVGDGMPPVPTSPSGHRSPGPHGRAG